VLRQKLRIRTGSETRAINVIVEPHLHDGPIPAERRASRTWHRCRKQHEPKVLQDPGTQSSVNCEENCPPKEQLQAALDDVQGAMD